MPTAAMPRPSRAWTARTSRGPAGRAPPPGPSPSARTPRSGPRRSPRPSSRLGVGGEELERRRGCPLLAHEQHRRERARQRQQRGAGQLVVVEVLGQPVAAGAVADLVVVLAAHDQPPGRHRARCRSGTPCSRPRNDDQVPSWKKPALAHLRQRAPAARSRRSSRWSRRSARRAARGGSRRSTARRARSRPPSRGVTSRVVEVGLRDQGQRPAHVGRQGGDLDRPAPRGGAPARRRPARARRRAAGRRRGSRANHIAHVVEDVAAHLRRALAVEVDQVAPGVARPP